MINYFQWGVIEYPTVQFFNSLAYSVNHSIYFKISWWECCLDALKKLDQQNRPLVWHVNNLPTMLGIPVK